MIALCGVLKWDIGRTPQDVQCKTKNNIHLEANGCSINITFQVVTERQLLANSHG